MLDFEQLTPLPQWPQIATRRGDAIRGNETPLMASWHTFSRDATRPAQTQARTCLDMESLLCHEAEGIDSLILSFIIDAIYCPQSPSSCLLRSVMLDVLQ